MNNKLYLDLTKLKNKLKKRYNKNGETAICAQSTIEEMAKFEPKTLSELHNIRGIGEAFVKNYGKRFIKVILKHQTKKNIDVSLTKNTQQTLEFLEKRLINLGKGNKLLNLRKCTSKHSFDLHFENNETFNQEVLNLINKPNAKIKVANLAPNQPFIAEEKIRYSKINTLLREATKDFRESGEFDLFVGYPFVCGKEHKEDFNVRAPLALFPVTINRTAKDITLTIDKTKDALYNISLILLHNKVNKIKKDLPDADILDYDTKKFMPNLTNFFKSNGIKLINKALDANKEVLNEDTSSKNDLKFTEVKNTNPITKLEEYTLNTFPKLEPGEFVLQNNMVLGRFSMYSTHMQKDYQKLINNKTINSLLHNFLDGYNTVDYLNSTDTFEDSSASSTWNEKQMNYITPLNHSQEQALLKISAENAMVMQGPPGTGKSQTITSIVSDYASKNKNVLMVSQKKAALDVINSRLGYLNTYSILIQDTKNKKLFYSQLERLIAEKQDMVEDTIKQLQLSTQIEHNLQSLNTICSLLLDTSVSGTKMFELYQNNYNNYFKLNGASSLSTYYSCLKNEYQKISYNQAKAAFEKFNNSKLLTTCYTNVSIIKQYPFLQSINPTLNTHQLSQMGKEFKQFAEEQTAHLQTGFFNRLFNGGKTKKLLKQILKTYATSKKHFKFLVKNPGQIQEGLMQYTNYINSLPAVQLLSEDQIMYLNCIHNIAKHTNQPLLECNTKLLDFISFNFIDTFEGKNRMEINKIANFDLIINEISTSINSKIELTKSNILAILENNYKNYLKLSKRFGEMRRIIESKRQWSITKYIATFSFELFKAVKIWLLSPEAVSEILPLQSGLFSLLIFDEASQLYVEKAIPAIARANKIIVAGDHKQLRPSSLGISKLSIEDNTSYTNNTENEYEAENNDTSVIEEESLLDVARFKFPEVLLNQHYRSKYAELINFSNFAFYNGRLNVTPNLTIPEVPVIEYIKVANGKWINRANKAEAVKTIELISSFLKTRKNKETLGVITFNTTQRDLILDLIDEKCKTDQAFNTTYNKEIQRLENGEDVGLFIKNIENVQGDERDCIIFSTAYAKDSTGKVVRNFGWLNQKGGENRLNVAISRAKQKIYLVTSISPEELNVKGLQNNGPKIFKDYLQYCQLISNKNNKEAMDLLKTFVTKQTKNKANDNNINKTESTLTGFNLSVYTELQQLGYNIDYNVGVGDFVLDFVIRSKTNPNVLLGIECDNTVLKSNKSSRERDYHKTNFYRSRGWEILRIWSSSWWKNREEELNKIKKIIPPTSK